MTDPTPPASPDNPGEPTTGPGPTAAELAERAAGKEVQLTESQKQLAELRGLLLEHATSIGALNEQTAAEVEAVSRDVVALRQDHQKQLDDQAAQLHDFGVRLGLLKPNAPPPVTAAEKAAAEKAAADMVFDGSGWVPRPPDKSEET